jgi:hypothetical protein
MGLDNLRNCLIADVEILCGSCVREIKKILYNQKVMHVA